MISILCYVAAIVFFVLFALAVGDVDPRVWLGIAGATFAAGHLPLDGWVNRP